VKRKASKVGLQCLNFIKMWSWDKGTYIYEQVTWSRIPWIACHIISYHQNNVTEKQKRCHLLCQLIVF